MEEFITNWTKEELNLYILIFCANADFIESKGETDFLKLKSNETLFSRTYNILEKNLFIGMNHSFGDNN